MLPEIVAVSAEAIQYLKDQKNLPGRGDGVDVKDFGVRYMTNILIRSLMSLDAGSFRDDQNPFLYHAKNVNTEGISGIFTLAVMFFAPKLGKFLGRR